MSDFLADFCRGFMFGIACVAGGLLLYVMAQPLGDAMHTAVAR